MRRPVREWVPRTAIIAVAVVLAAAGCGAEPSTPAAARTSPDPTGTPTASTGEQPTGQPAAGPGALPTHDPTVGPTTSPPSGQPPPAPPTPPAPPPDADDRSIPAHLVGLDLEVVPTAERVVALTFDAGANDAAVTSILATLAAKDVTATFFLTGRWVELHPDRAREIAARYPIANHSVTHSDMTTLSDIAARAEVLDAEATILRVTGQDPRPWWRFPLGARDDRTIELVNDLGYVSFRWTVDTLGWQGTSGGMSAEAVHDRVLDGLQPGEIVLFHVGSHPTDGSTLDADALPGIIDAIRASGYGFVTLDAVVSHG